MEINTNISNEKIQDFRDLFTSFRPQNYAQCSCNAGK